MNAAAVGLMLSLFSVLVPQKAWFAPNQLLNITVKSGVPASLLLTDFGGRAIEASGPADVADGATVDVKTIFPTTGTPGTYLLYAVPKGATIEKFLGTPLVIEVRQDSRRGSPEGAMVIKVEPLRYAVMTTDAGTPITMAFYFDVAPNTVSNFLTLAEQGYFDGLTFHRVVPGFVIQGGDPRGDGTGGPGYMVDAEFNDRPHVEGVLSMARGGDPNEKYGEAPRPEFANSAGSQFFVCLDYARTKALDRKYTAFGRVVTGMDAVKIIVAVTAAHNPYVNLLTAQAPPSQPSGQPAK
jgi:peptidyl-prolyl cis-trans isomerase B (cyclophilin B)